MSANPSEKALPLTPGQASDVEAASEQLYVEAADRIIGQTTGYDAAALLVFAIITIMFNILSPDTRTTAQIALALRDETLKRVVTVLLGLLSFGLFVGENTSRGGEKSRRVPITPLRAVAGGILAVYTLYVSSFVFLGLDILTSTFLPGVVAIAAGISVVILWQPWIRLDTYRRTLRRYLPALIVFVAVIIGWELIVNLFNIQQFLLPAPSVIANKFVSIYDKLVRQGWFTFQNALWGYAIGCGTGILFGLVSARFTTFNRAMLPYAIAANSVPIIAFAPIFNQWLRATEPASKIAVVAVLTFFPAMINTVRGLMSADSSSLELMRSYAATNWELFRKVRFPFALPYIFNALKVGTTLAMIGSIVAEYFGAPLNALGVSIYNDAGLSKYSQVWSEIIIASILGIVFYMVVSLIERFVMPWHVSFRGEAD